MLDPDFAGMRIIESEFLTVPGEPEQRRRTWRQRLFSRPWRPWRATYVFIPQLPNPNVFILNGRTVVMHPVTARKLRGTAVFWEQPKREWR
jgi:hypothetical protein